MKKITLSFVIGCILLVGCTQQQKTEPQKVTTLILVRHAEKADDGTKDPGLTEEGADRANALVEMLRATKIDAIYSTPLKRTQGTVETLSKVKNLIIQNYKPMNEEDMDKILEDHRGGTVVISGHSNTTPWVANYFLGAQELPDFADSDYDNLLILSVIEKGNAKLTWLTYGKKTN